MILRCSATQFQPRKALDSINRLRGPSIEKLFTPHFGLLDSPNAHFERNVNTLLDWKRRLDQLASKQVSIDEIVTNVIEDEARQAGRSSTDLPEFLRGTTRVSVLGFLSYLDWRSRQ
jgi:hypothetical protein